VYQLVLFLTVNSYYYYNRGYLILFVDTFYLQYATNGDANSNLAGTASNTGAISQAVCININQFLLIKLVFPFVFDIVESSFGNRECLDSSTSKCANNIYTSKTQLVYMI
jgi:hypothetical protein